MIVVAVIAILAVVAYPAYTESVRKSRRQDGITLINQIAQAQERWRSTCPAYALLPATANANDCNVATSGLGVPNPTTGYYTATIPAANAAGYSVRATATGAQASDAKCLTLTMTVAAGNIAYASTGSATAAQCWNR